VVWVLELEEEEKRKLNAGFEDAGPPGLYFACLDCSRIHLDLLMIVFKFLTDSIVLTPRLLLLPPPLPLLIKLDFLPKLPLLLLLALPFTPLLMLATVTKFLIVSSDLRISKYRIAVVRLSGNKTSDQIAANDKISRICFFF
jgi:hypothetical protein